jgi:hypothetical protein
VTAVPVPGAAVWVETYGVTLAADVLSVERMAAGRWWVRVEIHADPFGRYTGRATVADGQVRPRVTRCSHDTGAMYGCRPLCDRPATHAVSYVNGSYRFTARVCADHVRATENRAYPGHLETVQVAP